MTYRTRLTPRAKNELQKMPGHLRQRARRIIDGLNNNPRPDGAKELRDLPDHFRIRLEGWRIIYQVEDHHQLIIILTICPKTGPEIYQNLV